MRLCCLAPILAISAFWLYCVQGETHCDDFYTHPDWDCYAVLLCDDPKLLSETGNYGNKTPIVLKRSTSELHTGLAMLPKDVKSVTMTSRLVTIMNSTNIGTIMPRQRLHQRDVVHTREEQCCRPTFECQELAYYWSTKDIELGKNMDKMPLDVWKELICCHQGFYSVHPGCPHPPERTEHVVWLEPPACAIIGK